MDIEDRVEIASKAFELLEKQHAAFMRTVEGLTERSSMGCELNVTNDELSVAAFGKTLTARHRNVFRNGHLRAIEYPFRVAASEAEPLLYKFYLVGGQDVVFGDIECKDVICQVNNRYLANRLIVRIANALLDSAHFAPSDA